MRAWAGSSSSSPCPQDEARRRSDQPLAWAGRAGDADPAGNAATIRPVTAVEGGPYRAARLIGWPLTIVGLTYLVLVGGGYVGVFAPTFRMVDVAIAGAALGLWLIANFAHPRWRPATALWPAFGAILLAFAASTIASVLPWFSLEYLAYAAVVIALYLLLVRLQAHPFIGQRLGAIAVILLGAIAIYYLYVSVTLWQSWWGIVGRVTVPPLRPGFESLAFGNPSALGATCVLLFVASAAQIGIGGWGRRAAVIGLGALTLIVCLVTGARSVWLGLVVMTAVVAIMWIGSRSRREALAATLRTGRGRIILIAILGLGAAAAVVAGPGILIRMGFGDPYRPGYWLASLRMFAARPVLGQGPGTWAAERAPFTTPGDLDFYIPHGHNVFLQTMAELGIVGVLASVVVVVVVGRLVARSLSGTAEQRAPAWAAIAAVAYLAGHQLVDVVTNLPVVLFALALPISRLDALALARDRRPETTGGWSPRSVGSRVPALIAMAVVIGIAIGWLGWTTRLAVRHQEAVDAANSGNWDTALALAQDVVAADQDMPAYHVTLGLALVRAGENDAAEAELRTAATIDEFPQAWLDVAAIDSAGGRTDAARAALDRALRLGRQQAAIGLAATVLYVKLGDRDRAEETLTRTLQTAPSIAGDDWWTTRPDLADVHTAVVERLISGGGGTGFEIALRTNRLDAAATVLEAMGSANKTIQPLAMSAWIGDPAARDELEALAAVNPLDLGPLGWNIVVADHLGDLAARNRYRAWADMINGGAGTEAAGYRITNELRPGQGPVGTLGLSYGQYLYLRPIPRDEIVPGLPQLVYR